MFFDTKDPYDYMRVDRHEDFDYVIFGGEDHKTGQVASEEDSFDKLMMRLREILPDAHLENRWSGQVIETNDGLPFIGENVERQFIATGFCGNGMTFGTVSAMMARDWATGTKNPWSDLFSPERKIVRGGVWDYLRENKDYPYYLIKGRLERPEADSVRDTGFPTTAWKPTCLDQGAGAADRCRGLRWWPGTRLVICSPRSS